MVMQMAPRLRIELSGFTFRPNKVFDGFVLDYLHTFIIFKLKEK